MPGRVDLDHYFLVRTPRGVPSSVSGAWPDPAAPGRRMAVVRLPGLGDQLGRLVRRSVGRSCRGFVLGRPARGGTGVDPVGGPQRAPAQEPATITVRRPLAG